MPECQSGVAPAKWLSFLRNKWLSLLRNKWLNLLRNEWLSLVRYIQIGLTSPAYCWYNNSESTYKNVYGALYNWYAVDPTSNGGKNVCPTNWHVPTHDEWITLSNYLGGPSGNGINRYLGGGQLKEIGTQHWSDPNAGATNSTGFTALPGGLRHANDASYLGVNTDGYWWSSTSHLMQDFAWGWFILNEDPYFCYFTNYKKFGFSVRCLRD